MNRFLTVAICSLVIFSSCHFFGGKHIGGNGNIRKEDRTKGQKFSSVEVNNAFELHVKQDSSYSINIETDENLLQYIIVENSGDKLRIYSESHYNLDPTNGNKVKVYVSSPVFKNFEASGACSIVGDNEISSDAVDFDLSGASDAKMELKAPKVTVGLSGASDITLRGQTKDLSIEGSGASGIKCFDLLSENADVDVSGASTAEVFASIKISATASGASNVTYKGNGSVTKNESGASSIKKIE